jgi:hypothetical protein
MYLHQDVGVLKFKECNFSFVLIFFKIKKIIACCCKFFLLKGKFSFHSTKCNIFVVLMGGNEYWNIITT